KPIDPQQAGLSRYDSDQDSFATVTNPGDILNGSFTAKLNLVYQGIFADTSYEVVRTPPASTP
ncbi:hypothetical protein ACC848_41485, partial [Rhizobium johnstonii]